MDKVFLCFRVACLCMVVFIACAADYSKCAQRLALSMETVGTSTAVALNDRELLYFGLQPPQGFQIIKSDKFMGLYLLQAKRKMVPLELRDLTDDVLDSITGVGTLKDFIPGKVMSRMTGFLNYAQFSVPTPANSVITSICYQFYGLGTGNGFIESSYIKRFLEGNNFHYGDLGGLFTLGVDNRSIIVDYVEPFTDGIELQIGDKILELNGNAPANFNAFMQSIYSLTPNTDATLRILRNGQEMEIVTRVFDRKGGMILPYEYLSALGIRFSPDWVIEQMGNTPVGFDKLQVGDQILKINNQDMPTDFVQGAKLISSQSKGNMVFLVVRDGFQFFITISQQNEDNQWGGLLSE